MIIFDEESTKAHVELVNSLHEVLEARRINPGQALSAATELLGLVLINIFDDRKLLQETLEAANRDLTGFIDANWPLAQANRSTQRSVPFERRH